MVFISRKIWLETLSKSQAVIHRVFEFNTPDVNNALHSHVPPPWTHHSLWVHQQQVFGLTALLSGEDVLAGRGPGLSHQEIAISCQEPLGFPATQAAVEPGLTLQLLNEGGRRCRSSSGAAVAGNPQGVVKRL